MSKQNIKIDVEIKNILGKIFEQREEKVYNFTTDERKLIEKKSKCYSDIYTAISNVPPAFIETRRGIETSIENYLEILNDIQGIDLYLFVKKYLSYLYPNIFSKLAIDFCSILLSIAYFIAFLICTQFENV